MPDAMEDRVQNWKTRKREENEDPGPKESTRGTERVLSGKRKGLSLKLELTSG
jgi:hypothetical protein